METTALDIARRFLGVYPTDAGILQMWNARDRCREWHPADEIPWAGGFVGFVAGLLGVPVPRGPQHARAWLEIGTPVPLEQAEQGWDVVVLSRGAEPQPGPGVVAAPGHVGFFFSQDNSHILVLGGNHNDPATVTLTPYALGRVLGVRRLYAD